MTELPKIRTYESSLLEIWDRPRPNRMTWGEYYFDIVGKVAAGADCTRSKVGALLVAPNKRIIATGYNGAPSEEDGCLSMGACPRGRHYLAPERHRPLGLAMCACGNVWPCADSVTPGSSYDTGLGACIALHAEQNVFIDAAEKAFPVRGCLMVVTRAPCDACLREMRGYKLLGAKWPEGEIVF